MQRLSYFLPESSRVDYVNNQHQSPTTSIHLDPAYIKTFLCIYRTPSPGHHNMSLHLPDDFAWWVPWVERLPRVPLGGLTLG